MRGAQLVDGERLHQGRFHARCLHAGERVGEDLAARGEPGRDAADRELSDAGGTGRSAGVEHARDPLVQGGAAHRRGIVLGTPAQVAGNAVGVDGDGAGALVLGAQSDPPGGEAVEGVGGGQVGQVGHGCTAQPVLLASARRAR